jgi:hypothetical protein
MKNAVLLASSLAFRPARAYRRPRVSAFGGDLTRLSTAVGGLLLFVIAAGLMAGHQYDRNIRAAELHLVPVTLYLSVKSPNVTVPLPERPALRSPSAESLGTNFGRDSFEALTNTDQNGNLAQTDPRAMDLVVPRNVSDAPIQFTIQAGSSKRGRLSRGRYLKGAELGSGNSMMGGATVIRGFVPEIRRSYLAKRRDTRIFMNSTRQEYREAPVPSSVVSNTLYIYSRTNESGAFSGVEIAYSLNEAFFIGADVRRLADPVGGSDGRPDRAFDGIRSIASKYSGGLSSVYRLTDYRAVVGQLRYVNGSLLGTVSLQQVF